MTTNRHIVDQLADVREKIKALEVTEAVLKNDLFALLPEPPLPGQPVPLVGDDYVASVSVVERETLDRKAVEALLSRPKFQSCLRSNTSVQIRTMARAKAVA